MKRIIVCFDGTWNNPEQEDNGIPSPTNVFKIYNAVIEGPDGQGAEQIRYYHPGLGGEGGALKPILGGAFGAGIARHICSAYHWLGNLYEEGDQVFLFGFSRGAFTVRSIAGFLGCGLLKLKGLPPEESWRRVHKAFTKGYRRKRRSRGSSWIEDGWEFFHQGKALPVHFLGVWDTVGALGIPDDLELLNLLDNKKKWAFHDTMLGDHIAAARHAMAVDEIRSSFTVARWSNASEHADVKEIWFPGVHSDIGGGYAETDLSHGPLLWMMDESGKAGLQFRPGIKSTIRENPLGVLHNSFKGVFAKLRSRPRNLDAMVPANKALFHPNVFKRQEASPIEYPAYHPTRILEVGGKHSVDVFAGERWNRTGLYLEKGRSYRFSATGQWKDSRDACDWRGTEDGKLTFGDVARAASSFVGMFENLFKKISENESTDFLMTKRVERFNWFTLVGAIANDAGVSADVKNDGSPHPHQYVELPAHETKPLVVKEPGYLYCFPNDVWSMYENNRGSVRLTVERVD